MTTTSSKLSDNTTATAQTNGIFAPVAALFAAIAKRREDRKNRAHLLRDLAYLRDQPDHLLKDIGVTQKQLWDDGIGLDTLKMRRV